MEVILDMGSAERTLRLSLILSIHGDEDVVGDVHSQKVETDLLDARIVGKYHRFNAGPRGRKII